ncbi:FMN-binding protein [Microbacterium aureliae]
MKRILYAVLATVSGVVLLFGYRASHIETGDGAASADMASSAGTAGAASGVASAGSTAANSDGSSGGTAGDASDASSGASAGLADGTYTGAAASTRYGPVQVQITVAGGVVTEVQVPEYPSSNGRDRQINQRALPVLVSETLDAQSAGIDMVSGATYTSEGYVRSLQSALDEARP